MPTHGPNTPDSGSNTASGAPYITGSGWSSTSGNITADDGTEAVSAGTSQAAVVYIVALDFDFAVPDTEQITGLEITLRDVRVHTGNPFTVHSAYVWDNSLSDPKNIGSAQGAGLSIAAVAAGTHLSIGGIGNLWGVSDLTPTRVNSTNFGVGVAFSKSGTNTDRVALDAITATIYTSAGGFRSRARCSPARAR